MEGELSAYIHLVEELVPHLEALDYTKEWGKRPSGLCPYCPVSSCEYYRGG